MTTGKTIASTRRTCVGKVMSLLFNMLSRLVITFLPKSKCLLISWLQSPSAVILELPKIKSVTISIVSPSICHEVMGPDAMLYIVAHVYSTQVLIYSSLATLSPLVTISVVSSAYLRLLMFLPAILIPACASSRTEMIWT